jgi:hypothetical protein
MKYWAVHLIAKDGDVVLGGDVDDLLQEGLFQDCAGRIVRVVDDDEPCVGFDEAL